MDFSIALSCKDTDMAVLGCPSCFPGLIGKNANHLEIWYTQQDVETMCLCVVFHWRASGMFSVECGKVELC